MPTTFDLPTSPSQKLNSPSQIALVTAFASAINVVEAVTESVSPYILTLLNDVDAPTARSTLGLGSAATQASSAFDSAGAAAAAQAASQPVDTDLTAIAALATTSFGRGSLTQADASGFRVYIGAGTSSFSGAFSALSGIPTTLAGYGITDAQPLDSDLTAIAALSTTAYGRSLLALTDAAALRTAAALGTLATQSGTFSGTSSGVNTGDQVLPSGANPTASVGLTAVNGVATTFLRSDGAPALDVTIAPTWTGRHIWSVAAALSAPPLSVTSTWITSTGTATTTKPTLLIEPAGTTSTGWSTAGTGIGVNAPSGFTGNIIDCQLVGVSSFKVSSAGNAGANIWSGTEIECYTTMANAMSRTVAKRIGGYSSNLWYTNSNGGIAWSSSPNASGDAFQNLDLKLLRNAAGVIEVNTGTAGVYAGLISGVHTVNPPARTSGVAPYLQIITPADTAQTASTESIGIAFGGTNANPPASVTRQYATGALATHRENLFTAPTLAAVGASTITDAATVAITGAPVKGTNVTNTNTHGLLIQAGAVTGAGAAYGLTVNAPTGGTANYAAQFIGGNVGIGTASPGTLLHLVGSTPELRIDANTGTAGFLRWSQNGSTKAYWALGSAGTSLFCNISGGNDLVITNSGLVGIGTAGPIGQLQVNAGAANTVGGIFRAAASRTAALLQLQTTAGASLGNVGGTVFNDFTDTSTTSTNGTEDNLYSYTLAANTLLVNGDSTHEIEHVQFVSSATAARRLKKYFAGTLIFDSGALTLTLGGDFVLETTVMRESSTVVRVSVNVVTTSASSVPYATHTRITGLTLTGTNILKTTGIASGTGAASGDIVEKLSKVFNRPAA